MIQLCDFSVMNKIKVVPWLFFTAQAQMSSLLTNRFGDQASQRVVQTLVAEGGLEERGDGPLKGLIPSVSRQSRDARGRFIFARLNVATSFERVQDS